MTSKNTMQSFSQRMGIEPDSKTIQLTEMDEDLENSLWNIIHEYVLEHNKSSMISDDGLLQFRTDLMSNFIKQPVHKIQTNVFDFARPYYDKFSTLSWNKIYDLMQFLIGKSYVRYGYVDRLNFVLEREFSGYRVIKNLIVPVSNELETATIDDALKSAKKYTALDGVNVHLGNALALLSDRKDPDYRNSIKESVSAVETAAKLITGETTLGNALNKIEKTGLPINNQLKESFNKIYNFTNDKTAGIRHGVSGEHVAPDFETAKYVLVTSSAFVNYLVGLAEKAGVIGKTKKK